MIIVTTPHVGGHVISQVHGLASGSTIRTKVIFKDIGASLKSVVGGELGSYTKMMQESRAQALGRLEEDATRMGANAVINMRFATSMVSQGAAEILAYGTAVTVE